MPGQKKEAQTARFPRQLLPWEFFSDPLSGPRVPVCWSLDLQWVLKEIDVEVFVTYREGFSGNYKGSPLLKGHIS